MSKSITNYITEMQQTLSCIFALQICQLKSIAGRHVCLASMFILFDH